MKTKCCDKCGKNITGANFDKHYAACETKLKSQIKLDEYWKQENGLYKCPHCEKEYSKYGITSHIWRTHGKGINHKCYILDDFGKMKPSKLKGKTYEEIHGDKSNEVKTKIKESIRNSRIDNPIIPNAATKLKISNSMRKAHAEGKAWNIGKSRWNNEPSYPEKFFIKVIDNEFEDKQYIREMTFSKYSLDFAWVHKKKCIEIDGQQHDRFDDVKKRDNEKDNLLKDAGWEVLRLKWKDVFHNPKEYIRIAKDFIGK